LEWQLLTHWSHATHARFPPAFQTATRLLLLGGAGQPARGEAQDAATAAATEEEVENAGQAVQQQASEQQHGSGAAAGSSGSCSDGSVLSQLPGAVLEQVVAAAALPQACWAQPAAPSPDELMHELASRPGPPYLGVEFEFLNGAAAAAAAGQGPPLAAAQVAPQFLGQLQAQMAPWLQQQMQQQLQQEQQAPGGAPAAGQ
jgi:hypothetical protein